jgi:uncharacterized protein (TIGR01244 family)
MRTFKNLRLYTGFRLLLIGLFCLNFTSVQAQQTLKAISNADIPAFHQASETLYTSAQPSKEALEMLSKNGVKHVINLRPASELDWDEQAWVESLGMTYHSIPVAGAKGITTENATKLRALLSKLENETTLLHCSSSNRVGGLRALIEFETNGGNVDAAIDAGKQWGLTGLENLVREQLAPSAK